MCSSNSHLKRQRRVSFDCSPASNVYYHEGDNDDRVDLWYTDEEMTKIQNEIRKTMFLFEQGLLLDQGRDNRSASSMMKSEEDYSLRGLESLSKIHVGSGRKQSRKFVRNILGIYREHRTMGIHHPERLKMFCSMGSKTSRKHAELLAAQDEADAMKFLRN